ncbi:MAG: signal peptidase I [Candidatus Pacebacteria bacterium]|nr:signal peptidase I [Candidatus Paceibacterota bacterium]
MSKLFKILKTVISIAVVLVGLFLIISLFPVKGNYQIKVVLSGSMEPEIKTGSIVVIKPAKQYNIGDVVIFGKDTRTEIPTTHRLVSSRAVDGVMLYTTKGDANNAPDNTEIKLADIHGKVLFSIPYAGYVLDFIKKPLGLVLIIVIPAIFIVYDEIRKIMREISRLRSKDAASQGKRENNES